MIISPFLFWLTKIMRRLRRLSGAKVTQLPCQQTDVREFHYERVKKAVVKRFALFYGCAIIGYG